MASQEKYDIETTTDGKFTVRRGGYVYTFAVGESYDSSRPGCSGCELLDVDVARQRVQLQVGARHTYPSMTSFLGCYSVPCQKKAIPPKAAVPAPSQAASVDPKVLEVLNQLAAVVIALDEKVNTLIAMWEPSARRNDIAKVVGNGAIPKTLGGG